MTYSDHQGYAALHFDTAANHKRLRLFWSAFTGMFIFEVFPSYIFPLLNGINIICLANQHAPSRAANVITNLFGGTNTYEGLGFLNISLDWQYIGSLYMSYPLVQQGMPCKPSDNQTLTASPSQFLDWILILLHRHYGNILFQYLECELYNNHVCPQAHFRHLVPLVPNAFGVAVLC